MGSTELQASHLDIHPDTKGDRQMPVACLLGALPLKPHGSEKQLVQFLHDMKEAIYTEKSWNTEELAQWRDEIRMLKECRKALSGTELSRAYHAQRPHFQNYVNAVVEQFGTERVNTVLGYTVRHFDYDGRFDRSVKNWAQAQSRAPQPPRMKRSGNEPPRDFHELISDTHPVILNFVCHFQIEAAQEKQKSHKKIDRGESR